MFIKTTLALAIIIGTAAGALAAVKYRGANPHDVYDTRGTYVGSDPDAKIRFELRRDEGRGLPN
jgi:hypothetical protein